MLGMSILQRLKYGVVAREHLPRERLLTMEIIAHRDEVVYAAMGYR